MTLCEDTEVRHWFEEAAHQENFSKGGGQTVPSEESVDEEAVVAETPTWRQQLRHFEKQKKQKDGSCEGCHRRLLDLRHGRPRHGASRGPLAAAVGVVRCFFAGCSPPRVSKRRFHFVPWAWLLRC